MNNKVDRICWDCPDQPVSKWEVKTTEIVVIYDVTLRDGTQISFSSYSVMKANNEEPFISDETKKVSEVVKELISLKIINQVDSHSNTIIKIICKS